MKLKDWRESKNLSQDEVALGLSNFAGKSISQRTISAWESDTLPRKFWLRMIADYTNQKVRAVDFV